MDVHSWFGKKGYNMKTMSPSHMQLRTQRKQKRFRSAFTTEQVNYLESKFLKFPYVSREQRKEMAAHIKMDETPVKIWFQNRRMKEKKESNKETDDKYSQIFSKEQLCNVNTVPSTNDQHQSPLPKSLSSLDATEKSNTNTKPSNNMEQKANTTPKQNSINNLGYNISHEANFYKEAGNRVQSKYFNRPAVPLTMNNNMKDKCAPAPQNTSAEFSIDLWKKYKQKFAVDNSKVCGNVAVDSDRMKNQQNIPTNKSANHYKPVNLSDGKNPIMLDTAPNPQKQTNLNNPTYYPVMPTIYTSPFMSPDGVLWKPVNVMPVVATNTAPMAIQSPQGPEDCKNCTCKCHGSHIPIAFPQSFQSPYPHYVITVPFQNTSP